MIDLNNTWCEATEENYNEIIKLYDIFYTCDIQDIKYYEFLRNNNGLLTVCAVSLYEEDSKQIHLVNGEFQFVETKPKNNFEEYGFEADFEGEILSDIEDYYIGYYIETYPCVKEKQKIPTFWNKNTGNCYKGAGVSNSKYSLTTIKKEWYENPDNFPCIVISLKTNKPHIAYNYNHLEEKIKQETFSSKPDKFRPATKEEVLALLIKE